MPTEWRVPVGEGQEHEPSRADDPDHLVHEGGRVRDVLEHVGGVADVERALGKRKPHPVADDPVTELPAGVAHRFPERLDEDARCARPAESLGEVTRATADIDDLLSRHGSPLFHQCDGVICEQAVVLRLVVELGAKALEQVD